MTIRIITVETEAPDHLLTTRTAVKTALAIDESDASKDSLISLLIAVASQQIYDATDRIWAEQEYVEKCPGFGGPLLNLGRFPVQDVSEVLQDDSPITDYSIASPDSGQLYRQYGWSWTAQRYFNIDPVSMDEYPAFQVTYVAGYKLPGWEDYSESSNKLPKNIEQACIETVRAWMSKSDATATTGAITSVTIPGHTVKYAEASSSIVDEGQKKDPASQDFRLPIEALALLPRQRMWD